VSWITRHSSPRLLVCLSLSLALTGCLKKTPDTPPQAAVPAVPTRITDADLKKYKPNEAGAILAIMYHRIDAKEPASYLNRPPEHFRRDLERLHTLGYYPVNAFDVISNQMDVPAGKTPVVLTFDDALPSQFTTLPKPGGGQRIDPNCAVGIMETFAKKHHDWPMRATFFVLPKKGRNRDPFGQPEGVAQKFAYLIEKGYEIGSHTATHTTMRGMNATQVQDELGIAFAEIKRIEPRAQMQTLALPFGKVPRDKAAHTALLEGTGASTAYRHKAVFLAAWRPISSPLSFIDKTASSSICPFNPARLERVTPGKPGPIETGTLEYWLEFFKMHPELRYVSDGSKKIAVIPEQWKELIDPARAGKHGKTLQFYGEGRVNASETGQIGNQTSSNGLSVD
jgi:peptidoglycan/xylan/chitin deacetylase (PgdA/CDA1 family)